MSPRPPGSKNRSTLAREQAERDQTARAIEEHRIIHKRAPNVKTVTKKHSTRRGLFCDGCKTEIFRSTLHTAAIKLLYDAFDSSPEFKLLCKTCGDGADSTVPLARLFPGDFLQSIARITEYCSNDSVSLLRLYRVFETICVKLNLLPDVPLGSNLRYQTWVQAESKYVRNTHRSFDDEDAVSVDSEIKLSDDMEEIE